MVTARPVDIKKQKQLLLLLLLVSLFGKIAFRLFLSRHADYWAGGYSQYYLLAKKFLAAGELFEYRNYGPRLEVIFYSLRPPLYPLFIALAGRLTHFSVPSFIAAEALVSTLTVALVYQITGRIAGPRAALFAATLCAFYPYDFFHDTQLQENVLYNFFSLVSVASLVLGLETQKKRFFLAAGMILGLATLVRASHELHSAALVLLVFFILRKNLKRGILFTGLLALGWLVCASPWLVRNKRVIGHFALTSHAGQGLAFAHNEYSFHSFPWRSMDESSAVFLAHLGKSQQAMLQKLSKDEMARSRWFQSLAFDYMRRHKLQTLKRGFFKAVFNFLGILSPLHGSFENTVHFLSYWILTVLALWALPQVGRSVYFQIFLTLSLSQAAASFVFWAHTSHRSFLDPLLAVLAGIGANRLFVRRPETRAVI